MSYAERELIHGKMDLSIMDLSMERKDRKWGNICKMGEYLKLTRKLELRFLMIAQRYLKMAVVNPE